MSFAPANVEVMPWAVLSWGGTPVPQRLLGLWPSGSSSLIMYSRFHRSKCMSVKLSLILGAGCATTLLNCAQQRTLNQARNEGLARWASLHAGELAWSRTHEGEQQESTTTSLSGLREEETLEHKYEQTAFENCSRAVACRPPKMSGENLTRPRWVKEEKAAIERKKEEKAQPEGRLATEGGTCLCSIITIGVYSAATREITVGWAGPVAWLMARTLTAGMLVSYPSPVKLTSRPGSKAVWGFQPEGMGIGTAPLLSHLPFLTPPLGGPWPRPPPGWQQMGAGIWYSGATWFGLESRDFRPGLAGSALAPLCPLVWWAV